MDERTHSILKDARHAILWLCNPQSRNVGETKLPRTDIVEAIDDLLIVGFAKPGETWCKHCERWRKERDCRADPFINAEPRTYCPVAIRT